MSPPRKQAVLLLNFGGPEKLGQVRKFLFALFNQRQIIAMPQPFRWLVALLISIMRSKEAARIYQQIGGKSPQNHYTRWQTAALTEALNKREGGDNKLILAHANLTTAPDITATLQTLKDQDISQITVLSLFPQFSLTTTGACWEQVSRGLKKLKWNPELTKIDHWWDHIAYQQLLLTTIREKIKLAADETSSPLQTHILFSAHSLPLSVIQRGDPYPQQIEQLYLVTKRHLEAEFTDQFTYSLAYQSRVGPMKWLEPYLGDEIKRCAAQGIQRLILVPLSFISDHIETLYELDITYKQLALKSGIAKYTRVRTFNDDPQFTQVIQSILAPHLLKN